MNDVFEHARMGRDGEVALPESFRQALGIKPGDRIVLELVGPEVRILSFRENVRRLQEELRARIPGDRSLADELIAERRAEALRDELDPGP